MNGALDDDDIVICTVIQSRGPILSVLVTRLLLQKICAM